MTEEQYKKWIFKMMESLDRKELEQIFEIVQRIYLNK